ncbi:RNA-directed DNA polymerase [Azonexus fungiphilus]|uniref:RNA-directed DNA polymerase n=1 Tax=Azonexus fungiphilus TaxID=146940 RepID=A0A495VP84_9RHOO|nr:reverse transcriptase family protein [Azonexus fungiphilus]RKT51146.1 RNA-directed DNA polymerase [Azonexus fungiphilus]
MTINDETLAELVRHLEIDEHLLLTLVAAISSPNKFYRSFAIPKRRGGIREIESPYPSLGSIQKAILRKILDGFSVHPCAHAFTRKKKALDHAAYHLGCKELITLDIKNFFPSITRQMVFQALNNSGLSSHFSFYISLLCCLNDVLPQGACTSPALSNVVFSQLDERLHRLAIHLGLKYSRYADDLAFSGEKIPRNMIKTVQKVLATKGFELNTEKTRLKVFGAKKIITGVSITSGIPKAPRSFKRSLRVKIHELEKHIDNLASMKKFDPLVFERTLGKLNYLLQIEPGNEFALKKKKLLSEQHQKFLSLGRQVQ